MSDSRISLRRLASTDLPLITPWFEDPDTGPFLGGPEWPAQMLALAGRPPARCSASPGGSTVTTISRADDTPAGYIDCGMLDRCTVYGGDGPDGAIIVETIAAVTGTIAFVIVPELRGRGLGRAMIAAMVARSELRDAELFEAGVEPHNTASRRWLEAAGFALRSPEPDVEGMLYRVWRRTLEDGGRSA